MFANCDFYLQVSRAEGLPRALLEAMSQGLVCVGTRVGVFQNCFQMT